MSILAFLQHGENINRLQSFSPERKLKKDKILDVFTGTSLHRGLECSSTGSLRTVEIPVPSFQVHSMLSFVGFHEKLFNLSALEMKYADVSS